MFPTTLKTCGGMVDNVMGKIEILPTPSGNILKALIESGITCRCIISRNGFTRTKW
jgi:hypothetical protein